MATNEQHVPARHALDSMATRLGRFNRLGDELVVFPGISGSSEGYFAGCRRNEPHRSPAVSYYTKGFVAGGDLTDALQMALADLTEFPFRSRDEARAARNAQEEK